MKKLVNPVPNYDDVYFYGLAWLNGLHPETRELVKALDVDELCDAVQQSDMAGQTRRDAVLGSSVPDDALLPVEGDEATVSGGSVADEKSS